VEQQRQIRGSTQHRSLTDNEYHRLVHTLEQNLKRAVTAFEYQNAVRDWASVLLMLHGLRVEECSLVEVGDITINERSGFVLVRNGKGNKERTVPLNLIARKALSTWLPIRAQLGGNAPETEYLIKTTVRTLQRAVESLGKQIGVPDLTPHWLRYTFAKRLERNGQALETIRDLLGHESIETTRRYLRSSLDELTSAVEGVM
jgi:integrase/recombinase XerC